MVLHPRANLRVLRGSAGKILKSFQDAPAIVVVRAQNFMSVLYRVSPLDQLQLSIRSCKHGGHVFVIFRGFLYILIVLIDF